MWQCVYVLDYGDEDVKTLVDHFKGALHEEDYMQIQSEWPVFKKDVYKR